MNALIEVECIGKNKIPAKQLAMMRLIERMTGEDWLLPDRWGCWEIAKDDWGLRTRTPVRGKTSYSRANSVGSRGVYNYYILQEGHYYEVCSPKSWQRTDRYFCTVRSSEVVRLTEDEVDQCLNSRLG